MTKGEGIGLSIETLLGEDTPKEGIRIGFETAVLVMEASSEDPKIISFLKTRTALDFEADTIEVWYRRRKSQDNSSPRHTIVIVGKLFGYSQAITDSSLQSITAVFGWQKCPDRTRLWVGFLDTFLSIHVLEDDFTQVTKIGFPKKPVIELEPEDMDSSVVWEKTGETSTTYINTKTSRLLNELATSMAKTLQLTLSPRI